MQYWLMKTEPGAFSFADLQREGWTHWDGVRSYQAKNNLMAMKKGDLALIYHSVTDKQVVGIAKVAKEHYPDPSDETGKWVAVRIEPVKAFTEPVTLEQVKTTPELQNTPLIRQSRLSVMSLSDKNFKLFLKLGKTKI